MKNENKGELFILSSSIFFAITAVLVKILTGTFSGLFVSLMRFGIGIVLAVTIMKSGKKSLKGFMTKDYILRGIFGAIAMIFFYISIQLSNSARAAMLNLTYPIFVMILGAMFYGHKITKKHVVSLALGVIGVVFIFYDGTSYGLLGNILGLLSGVAAGFAIHHISRLRAMHVSAHNVYLSTCLFGFIPALFAYKEIVKINMTNVWVFLVMGVMIYIAQYLMTKGYKYVHPTRGSILMYTYIPLTAVLSYFVVDERITVKFIIGALLIFIGVMFKEKSA
ncbi:MAG: DMT family transporter [Nanoarchaeota archaeon]|nr:DMT family transporter [Nanoarchaeota archaeon]